MLAAGSTLGPYKILALLGAGGMGEVYRAHDSRLGRDVAIKVLSPHLAATPEVRARFEREARTISQLNHPHICTLHDIGRAPGEAGSDGTDYLVMELLEGETLAHRLERGPLPAAEVLSLGTQIADALDRAHRASVVHRDLKPGNVMLTKAGAKLMDFGLARAAGMAAAAPGVMTESPTVSRPLTAEGTIVGTFQYMAPEQLEGKEADARSDLWALGCVLYEMATGKRAFEGQSQASLISAIMKDEPRSITEMQPLTPPMLDHLVRRCLAKEPDRRWQSAGDLARELEWVVAAGSQAGVPAPLAARGRHRERLAWGGVVAAMAVAFVALALVRLGSRPSAPALSRLTITVPEGAAIPIDNASAALSPDGRRLAFIVDAPDGRRLWIRRLDSFSAQPLAGTDDAYLPFWSPDGRFLAFFAGGKLRKVPSAGGSPETICEARMPCGGSWSKDDAIVFAAEQTGGSLARVSPAGGEVVAVARPDSARGEAALGYPCFLPDGRHFLYVGLPKRKGQFDVYVGTLDSKETKHIMTAGSAPVYAEPGYLLFVRDGRLVAQRFDPSGLRATGNVVPLGDEPLHDWTYDVPYLCQPARGVLAYVEARLPNTQLTWLDRAGRPTGTVALPPGRWVYPSLSPDGRLAAVTKLSTALAGDLWVVDLGRPVAVASRLTFDGSVFGWRCPWSPDGSRVAYGTVSLCTSGARRTTDMYEIPVNGTGRPERFIQSGVLGDLEPEVWSPDGKYLVYTRWAPPAEATGGDLWLLPLDGERRPVPYLRSPSMEGWASISPDGRWLAYSSNESGSYEVYVRSFPEPGEKHRISTSGGFGEQWLGDRHELLLCGGIQGGPVYSVDVQTTPHFEAGAPRLLFTQRQDNAGIVATSDGQRFLAAVPVEGTEPPNISVILNWHEALKR